MEIIIRLLMELARPVQASRQFKIYGEKVGYQNEVVLSYRLEPGRVFEYKVENVYHVAVFVSSRRVQHFPGQPSADYTYEVWRGPVQCVWMGSPAFMKGEDL